MVIELLAAALLGPTGVFEAHDRQPTSFGTVTRSPCHDPDDQNGPDHDNDCDDHGVPVDGGWAPTVVLGLAGIYILTRRRREP
jgi:hypothetical protein